MLEKYCDILVIGTELPGLVTAAFLARRGLSVQVIDCDFYGDHPQLPDPVCLTSAHSKLLRSILGRLNVPEATIQSFLHQESNLQVIFPKHRVDVFGNPLSYSEELDREFPDEQERLKSFYEGLARLRHQTDVNDLFQRLIPSTWSERRAFKKFINTHGLSEKNASFQELLDSDLTLKAYFKTQYVLALQSLCDSPFSYQIAEIFNPADGEIFGLIAGHKRLKRLLVDRITHHDGHIRPKTVPQKLLYRNGVFEGVELAGSQDSILAKYLIWNAPLSKLRDLLPKKWRFRGLRRDCSSFDSHFHWFTVRYRTHQSFVPEMMKRNVVIIDEPEKDLTGTNFLYLQVSEPALDETIDIDVNFLMPKSALKEDDRFFAPYFERIEAKVHEIMPFTENAIRRVFPLENEQKDENTLFPMHDDDFAVFRHGAELNGVTHQDTKNFQDLFPLNFKTPTPNFFLTHPKVFAAFGLESKLLLGLKITDIIWQEAEKEKKRAMKSERRIA